MTRIYVFGGESGIQEGWPADLEPLTGYEWPSEGPVVVPLRALEEFKKRALEAQRMPEAILLVPAGAEIPADAAPWFDEVVREGEWDRLRDLLACPLRWATVEWVGELPRAVVYGPEELALCDERLPPWVREQLARCETCRKAFLEALEQARAAWRVLCPEPQRLLAFVRGQQDRFLESHIQRCPPCQAEVRTLQQHFRGHVVRIYKPLPQPAMALAAAGVQAGMPEQLLLEEAAGPLRVRVTVGPAQDVWVAVETDRAELEGRRVRVRLGEEEQELEIRELGPGGYGNVWLAGRWSDLRLGEEPYLAVAVVEA